MSLRVPRINPSSPNVDGAESHCQARVLLLSRPTNSRSGRLRRVTTVRKTASAWALWLLIIGICIDLTHPTPSCSGEASGVEPPKKQARRKTERPPCHHHGEEQPRRCLHVCPPNQQCRIVP